ncbi:hypothetical protein KW789_02625 [Candidatus Saccharibacteria bacterium]|jgi:hypothetical protein|nr:hypothetical protein [Candidatus Saccharibacteria bacterium]
MEKQKGPIYRIEDDLDAQDKKDWVEVWATAGIGEIEEFLGKYAAFNAFLDDEDQNPTDTEQLVNE